MKYDKWDAPPGIQSQTISDCMTWELRTRSIQHAASVSACTWVLQKPSMHQHPLMFMPIYDAFCCRALQTMHALRCLTIIVCFAAVLCCVLCFIYFGICVFFLVSVHANIGSTITNILIINIITQIPEGALLTCMPSTPSASSASSQILLSQRAQEAKSLGARPPFKSACLRGEKSRVPPTQPPSSAFPLQSPSFAPAASPPSSSLSTHARPGSALPE